MIAFAGRPAGRSRRVPPAKTPAQWAHVGAVGHQLTAVTGQPSQPNSASSAIGEREGRSR